jgi:ADP-heptose:LPS heptosyltransferase
MRIGLGRRKNRLFLTHALPGEDITRPVLCELARLLEPLGIQAESLRYRLDVSSIAPRRDRLTGTLPRAFAALHPFASKTNRCVALGTWLDLARRLQQEHALAILWIGSAVELHQVRALTSDATWRYVDRDCDGTLADTAAALSLATLFIGHDSGPLHVAGAFGVPVVGVFAPGEPLRTFPQGVGPSRMLVRPSPDGIGPDDILREVNALPGEWR